MKNNKNAKKTKNTMTTTKNYMMKEKMDTKKETK